MVSCRDLWDAGVPAQNMRVFLRVCRRPIVLGSRRTVMVPTFLQHIATFTSLPWSAASGGAAFLRILRVETGGSDYAPVYS